MKVEIGVENEEFEAELADNFLSRARGLSFRSDGKMLFEFSRPTKAKIDMMFLSEPLHLYFMDSEKEVIDVQKAEPWRWNPSTWRLYSPDQKYSYLLESFEVLEIERGDRLEFVI
ncbi:MAG: uncharacterized membrane protein (UPF0127 family) [Candidatus Nanohaloarchaea archaeon]|jgi:uncharacterized membrane protein (UPF0127 family)